MQTVVRSSLFKQAISFIIVPRARTSFARLIGMEGNMANQMDMMIRNIVEDHYLQMVYMETRIIGRGSEGYILQYFHLLVFLKDEILLLST
jgi:hypothetical protein